MKKIRKKTILGVTFHALFHSKCVFKPNPVRAWKNGRTSNFPICCIVWFILREPYMFFYSLFWPTSNWGWLLKWRSWKHNTFECHVGFVTCPWHYAVYKLFGKPKWEAHPTLIGEKRISLCRTKI